MQLTPENILSIQLFLCDSGFIQEEPSAVWTPHKLSGYRTYLESKNLQYSLDPEPHSFESLPAELQEFVNIPNTVKINLDIAPEINENNITTGDGLPDNPTVIDVLNVDELDTDLTPEELLNKAIATLSEEEIQNLSESVVIPIEQFETEIHAELEKAEEIVKADNIIVSDVEVKEIVEKTKPVEESKTEESKSDVPVKIDTKKVTKK